jgi:hypothetical protein
VIASPGKIINICNHYIYNIYYKKATTFLGTALECTKTLLKQG